MRRQTPPLSLRSEHVCVSFLSREKKSANGPKTPPNPRIPRLGRAKIQIHDYCPVDDLEYLQPVLTGLCMLTDQFVEADRILFRVAWLETVVFVATVAAAYIVNPSSAVVNLTHC